MIKTSISEFEREKPTKTMGAINALINEMVDIQEMNSSANPTYIADKLRVIKQLLKNGE